ncbi:apolipoprotein L3-like [Centropristis striata]|uniref:apolipoprotein L3-like n=1 Tax=Centropristis striata TaxID=184440 RepID=UPI0027E1D969|nr:apolipoprotein L3-like [Centropristis striata]
MTTKALQLYQSWVKSFCDTEQSADSLNNVNETILQHLLSPEEHPIPKMKQFSWVSTVIDIIRKYASFIEKFPNFLKKMTKIVEESKSTADSVQKILESKSTDSKAEAVFGGIGILAGLIGAPFTGGSSLGLTAGGVGLLLKAGHVSASTRWMDTFGKQTAEKLMQLGKEVLQIVEPMKNLLDEILVQAGNIQTGRTPELVELIEAALSAVAEQIKAITNIVKFTEGVVGGTEASDVGQALINRIKEAPDHFQKVLKEFENINTKLSTIV